MRIKSINFGLLPQSMLVLLAAGGIGASALMLVMAADRSEPAPELRRPATVHAVRLTDTFGNGRHEIFGDVKAGIYRTDGSTAREFPLCSWRLYDGDRLVVAGSATGAVSIIIDATHDEVESIDCKTWRRIS